MAVPTDLYFTTPSTGELRRRSWIFSVTQGADYTASAECEKSSAVIGASNASILPLSDDTVSRYHAEVEMTADAITLRDLDSTNGTFVDDDPIKESQLKDGDRFRVGNTEIEIQGQDYSVSEDIERLLRATEVLTRNVPDDFVAESEDFLHLLAHANLIADSSANVLLVGPRGSGKSEVAAYIHKNSGRQDNHMLTLTVPTEASITGMNTTLFGSGASTTPGIVPGPGLLERASGSSLFIEHLERLPPVTRSQLRTALQSGFTHRVGESEQRRIDVRLISATSITDLSQMNLTSGALAHVAPIQLRLPGLELRKQDIQAIAARVLAGSGRPRAWIGPRFSQALQRHNWKQNLDSVRTTLTWLRHHPLDADPLQQARVSDQIALNRGNVTEVARRLGVSTRDLFSYLARFDIDVETENLSPSLGT